MKLLRPFGNGGASRRWGFDLPLLVGHLEGLIGDESDNVVSDKGPKAKRLALVEDAVDKLNRAMDMGEER